VPPVAGETTAWRSHPLRCFFRWLRAIEVVNCKILPAAAPTSHRLRRPAACREEFLSSPDQRKDHSFFRRAIAVMAGMILRERMLNDPAAAAASQGGNLSDDQA
jgi:hypothetical protein